MHHVSVVCLKACDVSRSCEERRGFWIDLARDFGPNVRPFTTFCHDLPQLSSGMAPVGFEPTRRKATAFETVASAVPPRSRVSSA